MLRKARFLPKLEVENRSLNSHIILALPHRFASLTIGRSRTGYQVCVGHDSELGKQG